MSFIANIQKSHVTAALLLAAGVCAFLGRDAAAWMRNSVQWAFAPAGDAGMYMTVVVKGAVGTEGQERLTPAEVQRLVHERDYYRSLAQQSYKRLLELDELMRQRQQVFGEMARVGFACSLIEARVIAADSLPYGRNRAINVGRRRGVDVGSFVTTQVVSTPTRKALPTNPPLPALLRQSARLNKQVLVGRVVESWAFGARIQLITDRGFSIPANVRRVLHADRKRYYTPLSDAPQQRRLLTMRDNPLVPVTCKGDGAKGLVAVNVPVEHALEPGDEIITRDDQYFLPAGVRVARITEVEPQPLEPGFVTLRAKPLTNLPALRDVFIVYPEYRRREPGD